MPIEKVKIKSGVMRKYRNAWRLFDYGLISLSELLSMLEKDVPGSLKSKGVTNND